ncbi:MAG: serine/threonine-protein kinase [Candidatus Melainabacteria bacterium]|nr:serine/threonine-protein kinase [Candidatus Melainabacteria bacterium]
MQQAGTRFCFRCGFVSLGGEDVCPEDGSRLTAAAVDPYIGKTLAGKYEVVELLGRGGMSVVYKVRHLFMDRLEALKLMRVEMISDSDALQRFQQESRAVAALRHVNVVTVLDFGLLEDDTPFLTMEFLEGQDLGVIIEKQVHLPLARAIPLFAQICAGLHHAHSRGVIHRDIKPSNIRITTANGTDLPIIVDFGIAKLLHADGSTVNKLTTTGQVFGSPLYMSPEQCMSKRIDERTDIYALGCVFYHALTGVPPIQGSAPLETMMRQMQDTARPFSEVKPDHTVPPEVESVILKALAKNPDDRFANMNDLRQALLKASNMTITDLNSGSYIQSSGIIPGIGTVSGINNSLAAQQRLVESAPLLQQSMSAAQREVPSDSARQSTTRQSPYKRAETLADQSPNFSRSPGSDQQDTLEPPYRGLVRRPVFQIGVVAVALLALGLGVSLTINSGKHNDDVGKDSDVERAIEGGAIRTKQGGRGGYADNNLAWGDNSNKMASAARPSAPTLSGSAYGSAVAGSAGINRYADVASKSKNSNMLASRLTPAAENPARAALYFKGGTLSGTWKFGVDDLIGALADAQPGDVKTDGTVFRVSFGPEFGVETTARNAASALEKRGISKNSATVATRLRGLPVFLQEIRHGGKDPQNPGEARRSFVLYYRGSDGTQALQVVPGRKGNQATREFIDAVLVPLIGVYNKSP